MRVSQLASNYEKRYRLTKYLIFIHYEIALKTVPVTPGSVALSIVARDLEVTAIAMQSLYFPLSPV